MVAYEVSGNRDLMLRCAEMHVAIFDVFLKSSKESRRLDNQFDELLSSPQTQQESVCLREARKKSYEGKRRFFLSDKSNKNWISLDRLYFALS